MSVCTFSFSASALGTCCCGSALIKCLGLCAFKCLGVSGSALSAHILPRKLMWMLGVVSHSSCHCPANETQQFFFNSNHLTRCIACRIAPTCLGEIKPSWCLTRQEWASVHLGEMISTLSQSVSIDFTDMWPSGEMMSWGESINDQCQNEVQASQQIKPRDSCKHAISSDK